MNALATQAREAFNATILLRNRCQWDLSAAADATASEARLLDLLTGIVASSTIYAGTFLDLVNACRSSGDRPTFQEAGRPEIVVLADCYDYFAALQGLPGSHRPEQYAISVKARRIKKGKKTFVEVSGVGANRDSVVLLGGSRAERATVVIVCERAPYAADDKHRGDANNGYSSLKRPEYGSHSLHAVGLRADSAKARAEVNGLLHPYTGPSRGRSIRYDNSYKRAAAYAAAVCIADET